MIRGRVSGEGVAAGIEKCGKNKKKEGRISAISATRWGEEHRSVDAQTEKEADQRKSIVRLLIEKWGRFMGYR